GPASAYGVIGRGLGAYFKMINDQGGINGNMIEFITYDDGYSPPKTVEQVRRLVEQDQVDALFQNLGTPPNSAIHKYVNAKKVPHMFVATGASKWGDPKNYPWTMGWQPTYPTEAKIYAKYVKENFPNGKVGILFQNDDYGKDYLNGFLEGLGKDADRFIVSKLSYEVTDPTIDSQIVSLKNAGADIFFNITTPKFAAQAIRKTADLGWKPLHLLNNVSASVGSVLTPAGLANSKGIITATYAKDPTDPQWQNDAGYKRWVEWMKKYNKEGSLADSFNVYAYNVSQTMEFVLRQAAKTNDFSRENLMRQAANIKDLELDMLLPGVKINTSPTDFYPVESLQLTRFNGEKFELFGKVISAD
ncbi:MAG: ABC transporter substrate-binding protein, partial [Candidatus Lambdaproteobacteria bacterium]|nr:ABC transporter substrate-binding protein [Candidatus Lambdaproteobacteria bacterium]